jgi:hypothetical protein
VDTLLFILRLPELAFPMDRQRLAATMNRWHQKPLSIGYVAEEKDLQHEPETKK